MELKQVPKHTQAALCLAAGIDMPSRGDIRVYDGQVEIFGEPILRIEHGALSYRVPNHTDRTCRDFNLVLNAAMRLTITNSYRKIQRLPNGVDGDKVYTAADNWLEGGTFAPGGMHSWDNVPSIRCRMVQTSRVPSTLKLRDNTPSVNLPATWFNEFRSSAEIHNMCMDILITDEIVTVSSPRQVAKRGLNYRRQANSVLRGMALQPRMIKSYKNTVRTV